MMGSVFALTQYLQFAHGYSALEAGAVMIPLALGLIVGSGVSNRLMQRVGSGTRDRRRADRRRRRAEHEPRLDAGHGAGAARPRVFFLALSMGWVMAPATESVMSAVPEAKAGVGSAMSDVTRLVGGALGVAVIGSIIASAYSHDMSGAPEAAGESVGAAHAVAGQIGGRPVSNSPTRPGRRSRRPSASA